MIKYQLSLSIQSEHFRGVMDAFLASRNHYRIKRSETWSRDAVKDECMDYVRAVNK